MNERPKGKVVASRYLATSTNRSVSVMSMAPNPLKQISIPTHNSTNLSTKKSIARPSMSVGAEENTKHSSRASLSMECTGLAKSIATKKAGSLTRLPAASDEDAILIYSARLMQLAYMTHKTQSVAEREGNRMNISISGLKAHSKHLLARIHRLKHASESQIALQDTINAIQTQMERIVCLRGVLDEFKQNYDALYRFLQTSSNSIHLQNIVIPQHFDELSFMLQKCNQIAGDWIPSHFDSSEAQIEMMRLKHDATTEALDKLNAEFKSAHELVDDVYIQLSQKMHQMELNQPSTAIFE